MPVKTEDSVRIGLLNKKWKIPIPTLEKLAKEGKLSIDLSNQNYIIFTSPKNDEIYAFGKFCLLCNRPISVDTSHYIIEMPNTYHQTGEHQFAKKLKRNSTLFFCSEEHCNLWFETNTTHNIPLETYLKT